MAANGHRFRATVYDRMTSPAEREFLGPRRERLLGGLTGEVFSPWLHGVAETVP